MKTFRHTAEAICLHHHLGIRVVAFEERPGQPSPKPKRTVTKGKKDAAAEKAAAQLKPRGPTDFRL